MMEWKVEWVDEDGNGHVTEFESQELATQYFDAVTPMSMMADLYWRQKQEWNHI